MSPVDEIGSAGQQTLSSTVKKILGKDDFLKLMITQLKYQDPMEPTDNKEFIAQMAQFSSLEQMTNMSAGFEKLAGMMESTLREFSVGQAINMIGRTVTAVFPTEMVTGKVTSEAKLYSAANNTSNVIKIVPINTQLVVLAKAGNMFQVQLSTGTTGYINEDYLKVDDVPKETGVVTGMKIVDGLPNVEVNGKVIPISYIETVSQTPVENDNIA